MKKSSKLIDNTSQVGDTRWRDIILLPFVYLLGMSLGNMSSFGVVGWIQANTSPWLGQAYSMYVDFTIAYGLASLMLFLFVYYTDERSMKEVFGFVGERPFIKYLKGVSIAIAGLSSIAIILQLTGYMTFQWTDRTWDHALIGLILTIVLTWVIQGASEEILFRGYLLPAISKKLNSTQGLIISSIVFALLHVGNNGITVMSMTNLLLCGLALGVMAMSEESLWAVCGFHTAWNLLQGNVFGIAVSGHTIPVSFFEAKYEVANALNGGIFGIEGSILTMLFMSILIFYYVRKVANKQLIEMK